MQYFFGVILILAASEAHAAKFQWKFFDGSKAHVLSDLEQSFIVGDWTCKIGAPQINAEAPNAETRKFGCGVGNGLKVYTVIACSIDKVVKKPSGADGFDLEMKKDPSLYVRTYCE